MLSNSGNLVVATLIWNFWRIPNLPAAAALSVMVAVVPWGVRRTEPTLSDRPRRGGRG